MDDLKALETGLEAAPVPAVLSDLVAGAAIAANAAALELLGTPGDELIGADVLSFRNHWPAPHWNVRRALASWPSRRAPSGVITTQPVG